TIDLRTAPPRLGFHGNAFAGGGALGLNRFGGALSYGAERWSIGGGISRAAYTKGIHGNDAAENSSYRGRFDARPWRGGEMSVRVYGSDSFVRLNSSPDRFGAMPPPNAGIIDARDGVNFTADSDDSDDTQRAKFFNGQIVLS